MDFIVYDISLLVLFLIFISLFLYKKRSNLKKEGILFIYRTSWGMKLIDRIGKKYKKTLKILSYFSISIGYVLMASILWLFLKMIYIYITRPDIVQAVKVPPIMPLVPYLPQAFKLNFLPPFYFTYWIVILAIIAISHEFAHGIFMRRYGVKIKSTGFGFFPFFLPIFLAAFVEQDEKSMEIAKRFKQKAILAAGTFANILTAILFFGILVLFFMSSFNASGVAFDNYAYDLVAIPSISMAGNISIENPSYNKIYNLSNGKDGLTKIKTENKSYYVTKKFLSNQKSPEGYIFAYFNSPAINLEIKGVIQEIEGEKIKSLEKLSEVLSSYSPGNKIEIKTTEKTYNVILEEHPDYSEKAWLGIMFEKTPERKGLGKVIVWLSSFRKPNVYYSPKFQAAEFIYNLLWWLVLISFSVALVNMLPAGIFDGGRFFYLTILGITKSKKKAKNLFKFFTYFLLGLLFVIMLFWLIGIAG